MNDLTLSQKFNYRILSDTASKLSNEDLLSQLKLAHRLLKHKSFILDNFLQSGTLDLSIIETTEPDYLFNEYLVFLEFEKYNREKLIEVLLGTIKTLMHTENDIKSMIFG